MEHRKFFYSPYGYFPCIFPRLYVRDRKTRTTRAHVSRQPAIFVIDRSSEILFSWARIRDVSKHRGRRSFPSSKTRYINFARALAYIQERFEPPRSKARSEAQPAKQAPSFLVPCAPSSARSSCPFSPLFRS